MLLSRFARRTASPAPFAGPATPLSWARGETRPHPYVNVGDALSPVLVAMVSGRPIRQAAFREDSLRMSAIGTIGQNLERGEIHVWGSGCSPWRDPTGPGRAPYAPPPDTRLVLRATRGPMSARLLSGGGAPDIPFGDPAALLPLFHAASVTPRHELGVVLHLSELADRAFEPHPRPDSRRHDVAPGDGVRLITMVAPPDIAAIAAKIDEIRACRRVVSTSLHGFAIAAAYGVPCLYLGADRGPPGIAAAALQGPEADRINARFVDLLLGCGAREIVYWRQPKRRPTDWALLAAAVDAHARPLRIDAEALMDACPAGRDPLAPEPGRTIWEHPMLRAIPLLNPGPAPRPGAGPGDAAGAR